MLSTPTPKPPTPTKRCVVGCGRIASVDRYCSFCHNFFSNIKLVTEEERRRIALALLPAITEAYVTDEERMRQAYKMADKFILIGYEHSRPDQEDSSGDGVL